MSAANDDGNNRTVDGDDDDEDDDEEEDLAKLQAEIARMEEEAERITKETEELEKAKHAKAAAAATAAAGGGVAGVGKVTTTTTGTTSSSGDNTNDDNGKAQAARDAKSVYVGQVDYSTTPVELLSHFEPCGTVERVTIVCDKYTGRPKGYAYLEFQNEESVENALKLDGSEFKGRTLKVTTKRVNQPAFMLHQHHQSAAVAGTAAPGTAGGIVDPTIAAGGRGAPPFLRGGGAGRYGGAPYRGGRGGGGYRGGYRGGRGAYRGGGRGGGYHPYY